MANNPFTIDILSGQRGINQSLASLGGTLGGLKQQQEMQQQQQAAQDRRNEFATGLQNAIGSESYIQDLTGLMARFPEYAEEARKVYGFTNDQTEKIARQGYLNAYKNPEQTTQILTDTVNQISASGGNPAMTTEDAMSLQGKSPEEIRRELATGMIMIDPKIGSQLLGQQAKPMTEYQKIQTDLRKQEIDLKKLEAEERALERKIKRETDEVKKESLIAEQEAKRKESNEAKAKDQSRISDAIYFAEQKKNVIDDFINDEDYVDLIAGKSGLTYSFREKAREADRDFDNIKNSMTIENLGVMSGPLTDKDIQIIDSATNRLTKGMSREKLIKELNTIKSAYDRVIKNFNKEANRKGYQLEEQENSLAGKGPNARSEADILKQYGIE